MKTLTFAISLSAALVAAGLSAAAQETEVRVGWCTPNLDVSSGAPFAAADEFGWFKEKSVKVQLVPLAGDFLDALPQLPCHLVKRIHQSCFRLACRKRKTVG